MFSGKEEKYLSAEEVWNQKLRNSDVEPGAVNDILSLLSFVRKYEKDIIKFLEDKLSEKFLDPDFDVDQLQGIVMKADEIVGDKTSAALTNFLSSIREHALKNSFRKIPEPTSTEAAPADWFKNSIQKALTKVKTIGDADKERVREKLSSPEGVDKITVDLLKQKEEAIKQRSVSRGRIRQLVKDLWKGVGGLKKVVRTETMEVYLRTQLIQWDHMGVKEVKWVIVHDGKACPICVALNNQVFKIKDLLKQKYIHEKSHPNSLIGGTMISVADGVRKQVEDVILGDEVSLPEGDFRSNGTIPHYWEGNLVKVNNALEATDYHTIYFVRDGIPYKGRMDELREGDFLLKEKKKAFERKDYTPQFLVEHMSYVVEALGRTPKVLEYNKFGIKDHIPRRIFGTWNDYLRAANVPVYRYRTSPGKQYIIASMRRLLNELGYVPTYHELIKRDFTLDFTVSLIVSEFGSYRKLLKILGYKSNVAGCKADRLKGFIEREFGEVVEEYWEDWLRNPETGRVLPCDFYIPAINTVVEYDDHSHFEWTYYLQFGYTEEGARVKLQQRKHLDSLRDILLKEHGVKLVRIAHFDVFKKKVLLERIRNAGT